MFCRIVLRVDYVEVANSLSELTAQAETAFGTLGATASSMEPMQLRCSIIVDLEADDGPPLRP